MKRTRFALFFLVMIFHHFVGGAVHFPCQPFAQSCEGFGPDTLVQASGNFQSIQDMAVSEMVKGADGGRKPIVATQKTIVKQYIKICVEDVIICAGCKQKFYDVSGHCWVEAERLEVGTDLLNYQGNRYRVCAVEILDEPIVLHALKVEDHSFFVTQYRLLVHNADALSIGCSAAALEYVSLAHPVTALVGGAIALAVVAKHAYDVYMTQHPTCKVIPADVLLAERNYFERRKFCLEQAKTELMATKLALERIKSQGVGFTASFLQKNVSPSYSHFFTVSARHELSLSESDKQELRTWRELELSVLEQEIADLQFMLGLHMNELIVQLERACRDYEQLSAQLSDSIAAWNTCNKANTLTQNKLIQGYESDFLEKYLVDLVDERVTELKHVVEYYNSQDLNACLRQSTNLAALLSDLKPLIAERERWVKERKEHVKSIISVSEQHFASRKMNVAGIRQKLRAYFEQKKNEADAQALKEAESKQKNLKPAPGGPKKNDDENSSVQKKSVNNMKEFFTNTPLGVVIKDCVERTGRYVQGQQIYKMVEDVGKYLKKGDQFYLDNLHKNHLEVFSKNGVFRVVLDLAGNILESKTFRAQGRSL